jgi:DNA polymerase-3 subunit epsilon
MNVFCVLDFETNGLSPAQGHRATEVAVIRVVDGEIIDQYDSLMNSNQVISPFITHLTGITQDMIDDAPPSNSVMRRLQRFVGEAPLIAHNSRFDQTFYDKEMEMAELEWSNEFICTMALAKKIYPDAPRGYTLRSLVEFTGGHFTGNHHRATADAIATSQLFIRMLSDAETNHRIVLESMADIQQFLELPGGRRFVRAAPHIDINIPMPEEIIADPQPDPIEPNQELIEQAIRQNNFIRFNYTKRNGTYTENRQIKPNEVVPYTGRLCVEGYCLLRNEQRTFNLFRMTDICIMKLEIID